MSLHADTVIGLEICLDRLISRDRKGSTLVCDLKALLRDEVEEAVLISQRHSVYNSMDSETHTLRSALDLGMRKFVVVLSDSSILCSDVWRESEQRSATKS